MWLRRMIHFNVFENFHKNSLDHRAWNFFKTGKWKNLAKRNSLVWSHPQRRKKKKRKNQMKGSRGAVTHPFFKRNSADRRFEEEVAAAPESTNPRSVCPPRAPLPSDRLLGFLQFWIAPSPLVRPKQRKPKLGVLKTSSFSWSLRQLEKDMSPPAVSDQRTLFLVHLLLSEAWKVFQSWQVWLKTGCFCVCVCFFCAWVAWFPRVLPGVADF